MPIEPTVSRMVWYRPGPRDCAGGENPIPQIDGTAPLHSMICGVLGPGRVNLAVFGADGSGPYPRVDVALVQDDYEVQPGQCTRMPFQKGQANAQAGATGQAAGAAALEVHVTAAATALEAKGKEIHDSLTGVAEGLKAVVAEGEDKLRTLVKEITDALQPEKEQAPPQTTEPAPQG